MPPPLGTTSPSNLSCTNLNYILFLVTVPSPVFPVQLLSSFPKTGALISLQLFLNDAASNTFSFHSSLNSGTITSWLDRTKVTMRLPLSTFLLCCWIFLGIWSNMTVRLITYKLYLRLIVVGTSFYNLRQFIFSRFLSSTHLLPGLHPYVELATKSPLDMPCIYTLHFLCSDLHY